MLALLTASLLIGLILCCSALLAPIFRTREPRVVLGGVLMFAVVTDVTAAWASLRGFDVHVYDLAVALVIIGSIAVWWRFRPPIRPRSAVRIAALAFVLLIYVAPTLLLPVPLDTDAQGFGYLALMVREGGTLDTLAPFHPEISYLYSPAFPMLTAYIGARLNVGLHMVQMGIGAALGFVFVWLAYDFGCELAARPRSGSLHYAHTGPVMLTMALAGTGLFTAYMDSHYTTMLGFVFALAFVIFVLRFIRDVRLSDALAGALCLAAVPLAHPDTTFILMIGYVPFLLSIWLARPCPTRRLWLGLAVGMPLGGLLIVLPWMLSLVPLLSSEIASPFEIDVHHLKIMFIMSGVCVPIVALGGVVLALRQRGPLDLWMLTWLVAVVEFGALGLVERVFPCVAPLLKYDYPFSIAWHGPVIPFLYLGTLGMVWLIARIGARRVERWTRRWAPAVLAGAAMLVVLGTVSVPRLVVISKGKLHFFGAFSSHADVVAMQWLKAHAPAGARILNYPSNHEAEWAPIIAERDAVFYRPQPFFRGAADSLAEQDALRGFWTDPADPAWAEVLAAHRIRYVLVPQVIANPTAQTGMYRWRAPYVVESVSLPADAPYLRQVFDCEGARIYKLSTPEAADAQE